MLRAGTAALVLVAAAYAALNAWWDAPLPPLPPSPFAFTPMNESDLWNSHTDCIKAANDPGELHLQDLFDRRDYASMLSAGQSYLATHPDSELARLHIARAEFYLNHNGARAMHLLEEAERAVLAKAPGRETDTCLALRHWAIVHVTSIVAGDDLRDAESYRRWIQERHYRIYSPAFVVPNLLRLGRLDDADAAIQAARPLAQTEADTNYLHSAALDVAAYRHDRVETLARARALLATSSSSDSKLRVGWALRSNFQLAEGTRTIQQAGARTAWAPLFTQWADTEFRAGNLEQALSAIQFARDVYNVSRCRTDVEERRQIPVNGAGLDRTLACMLLALGRVAPPAEQRGVRAAGERTVPDAEHFARRARTARVQDVNLDPRVYRIYNDLVFWQVLEAQQARLQDAARSGGPAAGDLWIVRQKLREALVGGDVLEHIFRPYVPGFEQIPPWLAPALLGVLPRGLRHHAIQSARDQDRGQVAAEPFFAALEAEAALLDGDLELAERKAAQALAADVPSEALWGARVAAVRGEALRRAGRITEAREPLALAVRRFPGVFRLLQHPVPVRITTDGTQQAAALAERLRECPRFIETPGGFALSVARDTALATAALATFDAGDGADPLRVRVPAADGQAALEGLLARFDCPWMNLGDETLNALDASAEESIARRERAEVTP